MIKRPSERFRRWIACFSSICLAVILMTATAQQAHAVGFVLNFVSGPSTDIFGVGTTSANYVTQFGFTGLTTNAEVMDSVLNAVKADYLGYPDLGANASSPLPVGKELDIDFYLTAPGAGEYYLVNIGNNTTGDGFLGQACLSCVRNAAGVGPNAPAVNHDTVGSILANNIDDLAGLAGSDTQRINLLAGTISHEIGHSLSLPHPAGALPNPGESAYSLMGTGASPTFMPNGERVLNRSFAYSEFEQLIGAVGLRDVPGTPTTSVPEANSLILMVSGLGLLVILKKRTTQSVH